MNSSVEHGDEKDKGQKNDRAERAITAKLSEYQQRRIHPYAAVNVLLLMWEEDDIGVAPEVDKLDQMFRDIFNYKTWRYNIPSKNPGTCLNSFIAQAVRSYGGEECLLIVYYGGHGGFEEAKSPCTWAAQREHGPELDWDRIQPQLFLAPCDVIIILDCCFAGQAVRARHSQRVEFLAAASKDEYTSTGLKGVPSFTAVLMEQAQQMMREDDEVTIPGLHSRLVRAEHRLLRQPLYVVLGNGNRGGGAIKLRRIPEALLPLRTAPAKQKAGADMYFRLSLFDNIDTEVAMSLVQWMTKDSPTFIQDIQLVDRVLSDAKKTNDMGSKLLAGTEKGLQLSSQARLEASRLCKTLKGALRGVNTSAQSPETEATVIIESIRRSSADLVAFVADSLTQLNSDSLDEIRNDAGQDLEELKNRIGMRLAIIADEDISGTRDQGIRINFGDSVPSQEHLQLGMRGEHTVMVEYFNYDETDPNSYTWTARQIRRIAALQSEPKDPAFRSMESLGFTHSSIGQGRLGVVYKVPKQYGGRSFASLYELIRKLTVVPLDLRTHLAACICNAVLHLLSIGWFHKNLTSHNIVIFARNQDMSKAESFSNWEIQEPFLVGFDCSRPSEAETRNTVDFSTRNNIYRHPNRWGRPVNYERQHDLYSLGILLLEIGCWRTLPDMDKKGHRWENVTDPESLRRFLLRAAAEKLAHSAGSKYADAVAVCLHSRDWKTYEDWQFLRLVRQEVLDPLGKH